MDPLTIAAIMQGVGALTSVFGGLSGKKDAEEAALKQASTDMKVTQEKIYNLEQEERQLAGQTRARTAGSNVKADIGSPLDILSEQAQTFAREKMITAQVGAEKAELTKKRGAMAGSQAAYQGFAQGAQGLSNAFSLFG